MKDTNPQREQQHQKEHTVILVDSLFSSMEEKIQRVLNGEPPKESPRTIHRVRPCVREEDNYAYDPKIISIGPYHHGHDSLKPMDDLKLRYLHDLLGRSPSNDLKSYIEAVLRCEKKARDQYSEEVPLSTEVFVEMLVLDGCFIIEYLTKLAFGKTEGPLATVAWAFPHLRNDLLLLENQIPFFVLDTLFERTTIPLPDTIYKETTPLSLLELAQHYLQLKNVRIDDPEGNIYHLLHLSHLCLDPKRAPIDPTAHLICPTLFYGLFKKAVLAIFFGLLYLVLMCRRPPSVAKISRVPRMIPSATELREAGIKFRKKEFDKNQPNCFSKVSFSEGVMTIPFLSVEVGTNAKFRNLIAFEQCCPDVGSNFTSYVFLMDNLINTADDVAILQSDGIIESKLGSNKEVADMFNGLCKFTYLSYETHYYAGLFKEVREYFDTARYRWRAKLMHEYFGNPWAITSLVAASFLLLLTATQTFFSVFAYFRPPSQN